MLLQGEADRWDPVCEALLVIAARRDHVVRVIAPALEAGLWVVSDRFADSTLAYQGYGKGMAIEDLVALGRLALNDFAPDLTLILDLPVAAGLERAALRRGGGDRFERLDPAFHDRLRAGYRRIAEDDPARCAMIDAAGEIGQVHRAILAVIEQRLGARFEPA